MKNAICTFFNKDTQCINETKLILFMEEKKVNEVAQEMKEQDLDQVAGGGRYKCSGNTIL